MPALSIIVAMDRNRLIGKNNALPWHLPADLQHFKSTTMGKPVVMGRRTWESLGRPLPGRTNIVITRNRSYRAEGAHVVHSLDEAISMVSDHEEAMIIGGANLYAQVLPVADRLYITRVDGVFEGDAWFPELDESRWNTETVVQHDPDHKNRHGYEFVVLNAK